MVPNCVNSVSTNTAGWCWSFMERVNTLTRHFDVTAGGSHHAFGQHARPWNQHFDVGRSVFWNSRIGVSIYRLSDEATDKRFSASGDTADMKIRHKAAWFDLKNTGGRRLQKPVDSICYRISTHFYKEHTANKGQIGSWFTSKVKSRVCVWCQWLPVKIPCGTLLASRSSFLSIPCGHKPLSENTFGSTQAEVSEGQWHKNLRSALFSL